VHHFITQLSGQPKFLWWIEKHRQENDCLQKAHTSVNESHSPPRASSGHSTPTAKTYKCHWRYYSMWHMAVCVIYIYHNYLDLSQNKNFYCFRDLDLWPAYPIIEQLLVTTCPMSRPSLVMIGHRCGRSSVNKQTNKQTNKRRSKHNLRRT
jgi:hypothetical protein